MNKSVEVQLQFVLCMMVYCLNMSLVQKFFAVAVMTENDYYNSFIFSLDSYSSFSSCYLFLFTTGSSSVVLLCSVMLRQQLVFVLELWIIPVVFVLSS